MRRIFTAFGLTAAMLLPLTTASAAKAAPARLDPDAAFLRTAHQGDLAQIAIGRLAVQRSANPVIRHLGTRFAADSTRLDTAVRATAQRLHVRLDAAPNATVQQSLAAFETAQGPAFDRLFLTGQTGLHAQAAHLIRAELTDGDEPAVQQIARRALPLIKRHRLALKNLGNKIR
ncbi:hypothetical protein ACWT_0506 [Actinoplanes sp. SE50]|uniref:DUF4142 domain-containing protein n=1 Tax=unclassified Actinoplanes TaxID=2626549 RepID=UPI00023ECA73|nr:MULTISPECIES: DUF4142 domain-containing protein [unclassified Actinoplanes]AEV81519.1 hypothetical protein ACPL_622 [Actinoplanes sp. SE50/110]ATO79921.1 hypothetical protein ACWT_0506 [Actinoplanes sp. SE50]SLL97323.1 hypothetical protein ACSP50_0524 [Actinoplanes sp. SE50/110]